MTDYRSNRSYGHRRRPQSPPDPAAAGQPWRARTRRWAALASGLVVVLLAVTAASLDGVAAAAGSGRYAAAQVPAAGPAPQAGMVLARPGPEAAGAGPVRGAQPHAPAPRYQWPLPGEPVVTRPFDPPPQPWLAGHRGVDLAGSAGQVVLAAGAGTVAFAGQVAGVGVVSVRHSDGLRTTYQPVEPVVAAGDPVLAGDPIGWLLAGHPGCPITACLHWGVRLGERYLDPLSLLGLGPVRLLPWPMPAT